MKHCLATLRIDKKGGVYDDRKLHHMLLEAAHKAGYTVLGMSKHEFWPHGLTAVVVLAESHVAIHTYPEREKVWIDCFTCGDVDPEKAVRIFAELMGGEVLSLESIDRNHLDVFPPGQLEAHDG